MTFVIDHDISLDEDWGWSGTGACETCFYAECQCNISSNFVIPVSTTNDDVFNNVQVSVEIDDPLIQMLDNIEDDNNHDPERGLTTKVRSTSVISYAKNQRALDLLNKLRRVYAHMTDEQIEFVRSEIQEHIEWFMSEDNQPKRQATVYQQRGLIQSVKSGFPDELLASPLLRHNKFMSEVRAWARRLPGDTDEKVANAMEKYAKLLVEYPDEKNGFYMTAIMNNDKDLGRADNAEKRKHNRTAISTDNEGYSIQLNTQDEYPSDREQWWSDLTDRQREGWLELQDFLDNMSVQPDPKDYEWDGQCIKQKIKVPEKIKRKIRGMKPPVRPLGKQGIDLKEDRNVESEPEIAPVVKGQINDYQSLKQQNLNKLQGKYK